MPAPASVGYQPQIVDGRGRAGESTSIALDANGNPHIAYTRYQLHREGLDYGIWYTRWDGVRWRSELVNLVDAIQVLDPYATALALDSEGNPHIVCATSNSINYARKEGAWQIQTLASGDNYHSRVSMALDSRDNPHIVYFNSTDGILFYRYFDGANWITETIDPNATDDLYHGIVLDAGDNPHVSYYSWDDTSLRYAHKVGGTWQADIVENSPLAQDDAFTSIALDSSGNPGISYIWNQTRAIKLAQWNANSWNIQVVDTVPDSFSIADRIALAYDSLDHPHIIYAPRNADYVELTHIFWDGAAWSQRVIENSGDAGAAVSLAMDANDNVHLSYYDATHQDLRYARWGSEFRTVIVDGLAAIQSTALGSRNGIPTISYHDLNSGLLQVAAWQDAWSFNSIAFSSNPIPELSAVTYQDRQHISHYDADRGRLVYTEWDGGVRRSVVVAEVGDVGRFNDIALVGRDGTRVLIAYWDATNHWLRLAELNHNDPPVIHINTQAPALNAASGHVSIAALPDENLGISYYDGVRGDLRYAAWDPATSSWDDRYVDGTGADMGRSNDIQMDGTEGVPVIAYYDETNDTIKLAFERDGAFDNGIAVQNAGGVTGLSLALNLDSRRHARILYTTTDALYLATLKNGSWRVKVVVEEGASSLDAASLALDQRLHFSYADSVKGLVYGLWTTNLEFAELPGEPPTLGGGYYNPMDACIALLDLISGGNDDLSTGSRRNIGQALGRPDLSGALGDQGIFAGMASLFGFFDGGRTYIGLYQDHGSEMGQIGLADPELLWDSFGALQNLLPGLEALVTGRGDELLISQEIVDDALDIWERIAAVGSPALATTINTELAKFNDLQDFVGMSFDEWATAIGVSPLTQSFYLPVVRTECCP